MRAQCLGHAFGRLVLTLCLLALTVPGCITATEPPASWAPDTAPMTAGLYLATGDQVDGWTWLRDTTGWAYATWSFFGTPTGSPIVVQLALRVTDGTNAGSGVNGLAWVSVGPIVHGAPGPTAYGPVVLTLAQGPSAADPVGDRTTATITVAVGELGPDATGAWVLVERRGPAGSVVPCHIATTREAVSITGLVPVRAPGASPVG